ncbi:hypothetical protein N7540_012707 [Penicillium herquei]|uniref:uncharacterized protein n=1 Tax=Penicillium malachiteum TaxID=1324776 RepID=UPI0025493FA4|nr:uncharacterized protein N7483_001206 [Penicillium malachiteum]KAJ5736081.1 hypothetical protein N7483_001206 [Penicillium malachiteum]KAJ6004908.1 hypothetical protein N7540_012707 [Penicillium herquei]
MVWKALWLAELERAMISRLLQSQVWHKMVGRVYQRVQYHRHGVPMEESRTTLSDGQFNRFLKYFKEELQDQAKGKPPNKL